MIDISDKAVIAALEQSIGETFEGIAFAQILSSQKLEQAPERADGTDGAYIDLVEPAEVRFTMLMTHAHLLDCFAATYPDLDPERLPQEAYNDFVKELTNTCAGHFMSIVCPQRKDMHIGLPASATDEDLKAALQPGTAATVMRYRVEDHDLLVSLAGSVGEAQG